MKKIILLSMLISLGGLGFTVTANAQDMGCDDLIWSAEVLANNPNVADTCLGVVMKNGTQAAQFHARVVRQSGRTTIVQWKMPDGSWSPTERRYPSSGFTAQIGDDEVSLTDLPERQEVNVYVPSGPDGRYWTVAGSDASAAAAAAEAEAAAAAAAAAAATTMEEEEEPAMLPTTATQFHMLALLGGLLILLGGAVSFVRSRL